MSPNHTLISQKCETDDTKKSINEAKSLTLYLKIKPTKNLTTNNNNSNGSKTNDSEINNSKEDGPKNDGSNNDKSINDISDGKKPDGVVDEEHNSAESHGYGYDELEKYVSEEEDNESGRTVVERDPKDIMTQNRINMNFPFNFKSLAPIEKSYSNADVGIVWASIENHETSFTKLVNFKFNEQGKFGNQQTKKYLT